ncbi:MAG TPA: nucleotidyltransferase family protein [Tenuifilaceae bacterium]|nr:nucleotidyltransferase family protein [Tenuifilaceae bacterium]HPN22969.1 nucleotidyltransferase family protein [Tenuifilaceae bacterium]
MESSYKKRVISPEASLLDAFKRMDILDKKLLIVEDSNQFIGLLSAGDIQRAIINNIPLNSKVKEVLRKEIRIASPIDEFEKIKQMMLDFRMELCPVVDNNRRIVKVYFWEDVFSEKQKVPINQFSLPVVIMAGGVGSRLKPLTNVLPKPLIPIGEKTMLEEIFDRFARHGCNKFYISVNYKAELIEYYIQQQKLPFEIDFFKEDKPMGTAGSLSLLKSKIKETFFVSNCDIIIEEDYSQILDYHKNNKNEITLVAALKSMPIAYGTIETAENGRLIKLVEKPELTFKINSGMYILEPHLIDEIPNEENFHITNLIEKVLARRGTVGVYPVSEKSWNDVGDWSLYRQYLK